MFKKINPERPTPRHIVTKMAKVKETILKTKRRKVTNEGNPIRLLVNFLEATLQARREWQDIFKMLNKKLIA